MRKIIVLSLIACIALADEPLQNVENSSQNETENSAKAESAAGGGALKTYELEPTTISATIDDTHKYQSGASLNKDNLNASPSGNGDITSALKVLPNVQYDNAQLMSHTPGEIDPANISISGGLFYQNNFTLDGFNMNNDLDPFTGRGTAGSGGASQGLPSGRSQGFNIDTSLLDSIKVLDSNIGAAYGGFTGGVVEASIRNPRLDGWHFDVSYQHTSDKLTHYYIDDDYQEAFENSSDEKFQPKFSKHLVKTSIEGWVNEKFGIIGAFSTTRSKIPLNGYTTANQSNTYLNGTEEAFNKRNQTRQSDNYYLKAIYNVTSDFSLEANLGYMPQYNTYFNNTTKDSFYTMQSGGWQGGLKGLWDTNIGLWTNSLGYSFLENSRKSDKNYYLTWLHSPEKNWASTSTGYAMEGGVSDVNQIQQSLTYKSDMQFEFFDFFKLRVGGEFDYQYVAREIMKDYYYNTFSAATKGRYVEELGVGAACGGVDLFGVPLCSSITTSNSRWGVLNGQYIKNLNVIKKGLTKIDVLNYAFYVEEDVKLFDNEKVGMLSTRLGLRLDGDNYMDKGTVAPRLSIAYVLPWRGQSFDTRLTFGANRYYGRNLFAYRLYDSILAATKSLTRADLNAEWIESDVSASSQYEFSRLDIPYSDEVMVGLSQDIGFVNLNAKYINRQGKDEIIQRGSYNNWYYTNEGSSKSDIVSVSVENATPLMTFGVGHHFLLAFDRTLVDRAYNPFAADEAHIDDPDIFYDGSVMKWSERPAENFARPWTLRLNTTQTMKLGWTRLLWNNFFRYRSGYDRMVRLTNRSSNWNATIGNTMEQYGKYHFKGVFNWDMRVGLEFMLGKAGTFYTNVDIINVLNSKNMTTISGNAGNLGTGTILNESVSYAVYDIGRQFWLQFGYKY